MVLSRFRGVRSRWDTWFGQKTGIYLKKLNKIQKTHVKPEIKNIQTGAAQAYTISLYGCTGALVKLILNSPRDWADSEWS